MKSRREFLRDGTAGTAGIAVGLNASSYARILGANDRVNFAIVGLHGRGQAHLECIRQTTNAAVTHICDVDAREFARFAAATEKAFGQAPARHRDVRRLLESKDVDAITIATPEHWHAPMALMGLQSGKHV
jgi:predicted dehydrogenase